MSQVLKNESGTVERTNCSILSQLVKGARMQLTPTCKDGSEGGQRERKRSYA